MKFLRLRARSLPTDASPALVVGAEDPGGGELRISSPGGPRRLAAAEGDPPGLEETRRICALPVRLPLSPEETVAVSREEITTAAWEEGWRLWEPQARASLLFREEGGIFCPLRVGGGKSLIAHLCAKAALEGRVGPALAARRVLLHIPARVRVQVLTRDIPLARRVLGLEAPAHDLGGVSRGGRLRLARSGRSGIYVMPYSLLSVEDAEEVLAEIDPDLVIADEAHALTSPNASAKRSRWLAMMRSRPRRLVALSGTMDRRSLRDAWHLAVLSLGGNAHVPRERPAAEFWAQALDAGAPAPEKAHGRVFGPLVAWAREQIKRGLLLPVGDLAERPMTEEQKEVARRNPGMRVVRTSPPGDDAIFRLTPDVQGWRRAWRLRRDTAPGVVASGEGEIGVSLVIENVPALPDDKASFSEIEEMRLAAQFPPGEEGFVPSVAFARLDPVARVHALIWATQAHWKTPSGDEIEYAIHGYKWRYELTAGFYNELVWPAEGDVARARGVSAVDAGRLLVASRRHHEALQRYHRELREFLTHGHESGLDTPMLVGAAIKRGDVRRLPDALADKWHKARALDFEGRVERVSRAVRVSDFRIRAALRWREMTGENEAGIIWVRNIEIGEWAYEIFRSALGDRVLHCPAGDRADRIIQDVAATRGRVVIAALGNPDGGGHATGKNLQHFRHQYFLQWPRSAQMAEQAIGRLHRPGQEADELVVHTCLTLPFDHQLYCATLMDAVYAHVTDHPQKIVFADYRTLPKIYPPDFLIERGFEARRLGAESDRVLSNLVVPEAKGK